MEPATSNIRDEAVVVESDKPKTWPWGKVIAGALLLGTIVFVIVDSLTTKYVADGFRTFLEWIESNLVAGVFAFVFVYFVATVMFIPGSILTLGSGFVFASAVGMQTASETCVSGISMKCVG